MGVPQVSVIGPILFILYINDICSVTNFFKYIFFADDTNLVCSGKNLKELLIGIESELESLKTWFDINTLGKISKSVAILSKSRYVLNYKALKIIYNSLIFPTCLTV